MSELDRLIRQAEMLKFIGSIVLFVIVWALFVWVIPW